MSYFHLGAEADTKRPALTIRAIDSGVVGGICYALCDGAGNTLPQQSRCEVGNPQFGGYGSVTATFIIDGESVQIARA